MLTLARRVGQRYIIDNNIFLQVLYIEGDEITFTLKTSEKIEILLEKYRNFFEKAETEKLEVSKNIGGVAVKFKASLRQRFYLGKNILVKIYSISDDDRKIWLSFTAPREISILREEVVIRRRMMEELSI